MCCKYPNIINQNKSSFVITVSFQQLLDCFNSFEIFKKLKRRFNSPAQLDLFTISLRFATIH